MAKIRHVAFRVKDPTAMKDFYQRGFGFEQCYSNASGGGSLMVIDGLFNLALLKVREGRSPGDDNGLHGREEDYQPGINHFGFMVEDVDDTLDRLDPSLRTAQTPQDGRPAEMRVVDPWGNHFDLARGFLGREEKRLPAVRQVVLQTDRPDAAADFYTSKLGLVEEGTASDGSVYLGDGYIHLALVQEGLTAKRGLQYIGIQVDDWDALAERFKAMGRPLPTPPTRAGEVLIRDLEGNLLLLSEKGWDR